MKGEADTAGLVNKLSQIESDLGKAVSENTRKCVSLSNERIHISVCWESICQPVLNNGAMEKWGKGQSKEKDCVVTSF